MIQAMVSFKPWYDSPLHRTSSPLQKRGTCRYPSGLSFHSSSRESRQHPGTVRSNHQTCIFSFRRDPSRRSIVFPSCRQPQCLQRHHVIFFLRLPPMSDSCDPTMGSQHLPQAFPFCCHSRERSCCSWEGATADEIVFWFGQSIPVSLWNPMGIQGHLKEGLES